MPKPTTTERDDMPGDIIKLVHEYIGSPVDHTKFIEALVMYIVRRDGLVKDAGIELGKKLGHDHPEIKQAIGLLQDWVDVSANVTSNPKIAKLAVRSKDYIDNV